MARDVLAEFDQPPIQPPAQPVDLLAEPAVEQQPEQRGVLQTGLSGLGTLAEIIDRFTGAPVRAGISALQQGESPFGPAIGQLLGRGEQAPTGEQIAAQAGISPEPLQALVPTGEVFPTPGRQIQRQVGPPERVPTVSPAQIAGLGIDIAADPLNLLPGGLLTRAIRPGTRALRATRVGQTATQLAQAARQKGLRAFAKVGNLSGIPEQDIINFVNRNKQVKKVIKEFGTSAEDIQAAAFDFTETAQKAIKAQKKTFNDDVAKFFDVAKAGDKKLNIEPIVDSLQKKIGQLDEIADVDSIAEINAKISQLINASDDVGQVSAKRLNRFRKTLSEESGNRAFAPTTFRGGSDVQQALADASKVASDSLKKESPKLKEAFAGLTDLRKFEQRFAPVGRGGAPTTGILSPERSLSAITSGVRGNLRQRAALEELSRITDQPFFQRAQDIAAARTLGGAGLFPTQPTGRSLLGPGLALTSGALGRPITAAAFGALSSPLALRLALEGGLRGQRFLGATVPRITPAIQAARISGGFLNPVQ